MPTTDVRAHVPTPPTATLTGPYRPKRTFWQRAATLAGFIAVSQAAGAVGAAFTFKTVKTWYPTLAKPPLQPPPSIFGPVWTTLYTLMGVSAWMVWERRHQPAARRSLGLFAAQLGLNAAWSGAFFGARSPEAGLATIVPLWGLIGAYTVSTWEVSKAASLLFVPYWGWVSFATYLNGGIYALNRKPSAWRRALQTGERAWARA